MPRPGYVSVSIKEDEWDRAEEIVAAYPEKYASPTELVRDAIREKCEALEARLAAPRPRRRSE